MKNYKVYSDVKLESLESSVGSAMDKGWNPVGGVAVVKVKLNSSYEPDEKGKPTVLYLQAMTQG